MDNLINLNHKITYNEPLLYKKFNIADDNEDAQEQLYDVIYKYDLLCIFGLDDFLEDIVVEKISKLYSIMVTNVDIQKMCPDIETFMILFSYDHLHIFYPCICEFIKQSRISNENLILLKKQLQS
jgi:hypothetical protein